MTLKTLTRNSLIGLALVIIVYALFYLWLDIPLMYFIRAPFAGTFIAQLCNIIGLVASPMLWFIIGVIALMYTGYQFKNKQTCPAFTLYWGCDIVAAFILTTALKIILARYRPIELLDDNLYGFHFFSMQHDLNSTPSGHTTMAFAGLFGLARRLKKSWLTPLLMIVAVLIALSRIIVADHYISDVILGGYVGLTSVYWVDFILDHYCPCPRSASS